MDHFKKAHALPISEISDKFKTDLKLGLNSIEAKKRCHENGFNSLIKEKKNLLFLQLLEQFKDPIIVVLIGAFTVTLLLQNYKNALAILLVVFLNTSLGFYQQWKASKSIEALSSYLAHQATVIRDGIKQTILAKELTLGDLIYLESGQKVPADARLVETTNLTVDQSILSGESLPVEKEAVEIYPNDCLPNHQNNMVFSGTSISTGRALAVVTAIGHQTELGEMSRSIEEIDETPSPLQVRLKHFSKYLTLLILLLIVVICGVGLIRGFDPFSLFLMAVSLIVTAIPEGLPLAVTLCLSTGIHHMAKRKAIVRRLAAVETLGSCNVICSDKTGTITSQQMTVTEIYVGNSKFEVTGSGYDPKGKVLGNVNLAKFASICAFTHECEIIEKDQKFICVGDPTEGALVTLAKKIGGHGSIDAITFDIPFESERRWMAVTVKKENEHSVYIKGALSEILKKCRAMLNEKGQVVDLDKNRICHFEDEIAQKGCRIIALGYMDISVPMHAREIDAAKDFIFVGLAAIQDPPREEVYQAIRKCKDAHIKVKMITGDFQLTAKSIGEKIKITDEPIKVVTGEELEKLSAECREKIIQEAHIFARVLPKHKVMIVAGLQAEGDVVAMTGDGVNDAASLKKADMGVAMGSGSDVSKEAASLVILDDNFSTIVEAIKQGRIIFDNLQKMILYLITTAISGVGVLMTTTFLGFPIPLLPIQLLWINLVTDGSSTIPLALEKGDEDVLKRPPYAKSKPFISGKMIFKMMMIGLYMSFATVLIFGIDYFIFKDSLAKAQTFAFTTLAFFQIWNVQCCRSVSHTVIFDLKRFGLKRLSILSNKMLLVLMVVASVLQVLAVEVPVLRFLLGTTSLSLKEWLVAVGSTLSIFLISDLSKIFGFFILKNNRN